jgi:hypothetical protein
MILDVYLPLGLRADFCFLALVTSSGTVLGGVLVD